MLRSPSASWVGVGVCCHCGSPSPPGYTFSSMFPCVFTLFISPSPPPGTVCDRLQDIKNGNYHCMRALALLERTAPEHPNMGDILINAAYSLYTTCSLPSWRSRSRCPRAPRPRSRSSTGWAQQRASRHHKDAPPRDPRGIGARNSRAPAGQSHGGDNTVTASIPSGGKPRPRHRTRALGVLARAGLW